MTIIGLLVAVGIQGCGDNGEDELDNDEIGEDVGEIDFEDDMEMPPPDEMAPPPDDMPAPDVMMPDGADAASLVADGMQAKHAGDYQRALESFEAAVAADPSNVDAHWGLAWVSAESGRTERAVEAFETVIQLGASPDKVQEAEAALQRLQ